MASSSSTASAASSIPSSHRAVISTGPSSDPVIESIPTPVLDPNSDLILVRVVASSVNPVDYKQWHHNFFNQALPLALGWDVSGVIIAIGNKAVGGWRIGDEVFGALSLGGPGSHSGYVLTDGLRLARKPSSLTHLQAACLPIAFQTAYDGVVTLAKLTPQSTILIAGATGGVGHFAVQLAKSIIGARVIALASKSDGIALLREYGVDSIIDYKTENVAARTLELTDGKGADVVFDTTAGLSYATTAGAVRAGGRFIGVDPSPPAESAPFWAVLKSRDVTDIVFADVVKSGTVPGFEHLRVAAFQVAGTWAADLVASKRIRLHHSVIPFSQVPQAIKDIASGKSFLGKVAVQHD